MDTSSIDYVFQGTQRLQECAVELARDMKNLLNVLDDIPTNALEVVVSVIVSASKRQPNLSNLYEWH